MSDKPDLARAFRELVYAYVGKSEDDPTRPTWDQVDAAQAAFIDSIPGLREKIIRQTWSP